MARYLLDTGVLIHIVRGSPLASHIAQQYTPTVQPNYASVSVVTIGEMQAFAYRNKWGREKQEALEALVNTVPTVDINHSKIILKYAEIDAYCQNKHREQQLPKGDSAHKLGDNDLWIAASAAVLKATLITLDKDFCFLNGIFLDVIYIEQQKP